MAKSFRRRQAPSGAGGHYATKAMNDSPDTGPMTDWSTGNCEANGINIHYTRTRGSKPPLLLLHGLTANGACWTPFAQTMQGEYDVIMPDARGHGKSSVPDDGYRYEDLANDVVGLIEALQLASPIL